MCAQWADNENKSKELVQALLIPIVNQFVPDPQGGVSGTNFGAMMEYVSAIETYIKISSQIPLSLRYTLLQNAVWAAARDGKLEVSNLLQYIGQEESNYLSKPKEDYEFISSLSIKYFKQLNRSRLKPPVFFSSQRARKYDFSAQLKEYDYLPVEEIPQDYTHLRIPVKARNIQEAYLAGIEALDLLRAYWNWGFERQRYFINSDATRRPTNLIRLGPYQTIRKPDGKLDNDFWYETDYLKEPAVDISNDWNRISDDEKASRKNIKNHPYREDIERALRRYVQALDYRDLNLSFLKLWQLLEKLTGTNNANYDQLIKRVAFLYQNVNLHKGMLNHLRLHRNFSVHDGRESQQIEHYLHQAKSYVRRIINHHVNNPFKATSMSEAVGYLDSLTDPSELQKQFERTKKVMKFRAPRP